MGNYFDFNEALKYVGGYAHIFEKLRQKFIENYADYKVRLMLLVKKNDIEGIKAMVHSLKGITKNLGASKLYAVSVEVENKLQSNLNVDFDKYLDTFDNTYMEIKNYRCA